MEKQEWATFSCIHYLLFFSRSYSSAPSRKSKEMCVYKILLIFMSTKHLVYGIFAFIIYLLLLMKVDGCKAFTRQFRFLKLSPFLLRWRKSHIIIFLLLAFVLLFMVLTIVFLCLTFLYKIFRQQWNINEWTRITKISWQVFLLFFLLLHAYEKQCGNWLKNYFFIWVGYSFPKNCFDDKQFASQEM